MYDLLAKPITKNGLSTAEFMHDYFPYDKSSIHTLELNLDGKNYNDEIWLKKHDSIENVVEDIKDNSATLGNALIPKRAQNQMKKENNCMDNRDIIFEIDGDLNPRIMELKKKI